MTSELQNRLRPAVCLLAILGAPLPAAPAESPPVTAVAFAPDGKSVVVGSQSGVEVLSWPDLKPVRKLGGKLPHVHDLAFSPKGDVLAAAGGAPAEEGAVEFFAWPRGDLLRREPAHADVVHAVTWSADGRLWATASADRTCRVHDAATAKLIRAFEGHSRPVLALCFTPDGKHVVSAGVDQSLRVWDARTGREVRALENHTGPVHALAVRPAPAGEAPPTVASASADRTVRLWQPTTGRMVRFARLPSAPLCLAWTADGTRLLAGCADGRLRGIDPDTAEVCVDEAGLDGRPHALAVSPRGDAVLLGGENGRLRRLALPRP